MPNPRLQPCSRLRFVLVRTYNGSYEHSVLENASKKKLRRSLSAGPKRRQYQLEARLSSVPDLSLLYQKAHMDG